MSVNEFIPVLSTLLAKLVESRFSGSFTLLVGLNEFVPVVPIFSSNWVKIGAVTTTLYFET